MTSLLWESRMSFSKVNTISHSLRIKYRIKTFLDSIDCYTKNITELLTQKSCISTYIPLLN